VKALFDEEFLGRFLDTTLILLDRAGTEFGHSAYKNERPYFYLDLRCCQDKFSRKGAKEDAKAQRTVFLAPLRLPLRLCVKKLSLLDLVHLDAEFAGKFRLMSENMMSEDMMSEDVDSAWGAKVS
jgi:hypothetical protein